MLSPRKKEFEKIKEVIKENFCFGECGIYNVKNLVGDYMINIFKGKFFKVDFCYRYSYFEVFGTNTNEFNELLKFYENLSSQKIENEENE